jgi:hypothetical protein
MEVNVSTTRRVRGTWRARVGARNRVSEQVYAWVCERVSVRFCMWRVGREARARCLATQRGTGGERGTTAAAAGGRTCTQ